MDVKDSFPKINLDPDWELGFLSKNLGSFNSTKCGVQVKADESMIETEIIQK